jgi:quinol monooxygenase YgiN
MKKHRFERTRRDQDTRTPEKPKRLSSISHPRRTHRMGDRVSWQVELTVKPGELDNFRTLTRRMADSTRGERGVLSYERFVSGDGTVVHVYERYADSAAAVAHLRTFGRKFGRRFVGMVERKRFTVYGVPSNELRGMLDGFGATYLRPFGGFC